MRLTLRELDAILTAVTAATAGELDGYTDAEAKAIETAERKLKTELARREARSAQRKAVAR